jgi:hypothetical protein
LQKRRSQTGRVVDTLPDVDIVMTLNVSEKMNARYELSHGFYSTGLAIATVEPKKETAWGTTKRIFSGGFVLILVGVFVLLTLVGFLMWWFEKKPVEPLPKEKAALSKALFWPLGPMIGYKASQHATRAVRVLARYGGYSALCCQRTNRESRCPVDRASPRAVGRRCR